jgi:hypothetical protein
MSDRIRRLQQEAEAIRQEGFVAGWEAAMETVAKVTRSLPPSEQPQSTSLPVGSQAKNPNAMPRGATDIAVDQILQEIAPRALSPKQIITEARLRGSILSESAVRRALDKLVSQGKAQQVGDAKCWHAVTPGVSEEQLKSFGIIPPHAKVVGIKN